MAFHVSAGFAYSAEIVAEEGGKPHVFEDNLFDMHAPPFRHFLHEFGNLFVDLYAADEQILQDLNEGKSTYYPQMVRIVTKVISARLRVRSRTR